MSRSFTIGIWPRSACARPSFPFSPGCGDTGSMTINALAEEMVMDRTTLGRNILPLERDGLISIKPGRTDRRSKELRLTDAGLERLRAGFQGWKDAQREFATAFGDERTVGLRALAARGCRRPIFPWKPPRPAERRNVQGSSGFRSASIRWTI